MRFPVVLLWINAALFVVFGAVFIIAPALLSQVITGATPGTTNALIDMRATYGGMALGIGLFWAIALADRVRCGSAWFRPCWYCWALHWDDWLA